MRALLSQHKSEDKKEKKVDRRRRSPRRSNSMPEDRTCACHTSPLASVLCWLRRVHLRPPVRVVRKCHREPRL